MVGAQSLALRARDKISFVQVDIFHELSDDGAEIVTGKALEIVNIVAEEAARLFTVEFYMVNVTAFIALSYLCSTVICRKHSSILPFYSLPFSSSSTRLYK